MVIQTINDFRRAYRNGPWAWPGGYPLFYVTEDGEALSFEAVRANLRQVLSAIANRDNSGGWRVIGLEVNYEDSALYCAHTGRRIESAYAEEEAEESAA
jgi:hypothetical protein